MSHVAAAGTDLTEFVHGRAGVGVALVLLVQLRALRHKERLDKPRIAEGAAQIVGLRAHDQLAGVNGRLQVREGIGLGLGAPQNGEVALQLLPFTGEVVLPIGGGRGQRGVVVVQQRLGAIGRLVAQILAVVDDAAVDRAIAAVAEIQALALLFQDLGEPAGCLSCGHLPSFLYSSMLFMRERLRPLPFPSFCHAAKPNR